MTDTAQGQITVKRDGDRDLHFRGRQVGAGEFGVGEFWEDWNRGTRVTIYITAGGKIITAVLQWSRWQGETPELNRAAVHATADEALAWLTRDSGGTLGRASKEAWAEACSIAPELAGQDVEEVE